MLTGVISIGSRRVIESAVVFGGAFRTAGHCTPEG